MPKKPSMEKPEVKKRNVKKPDVRKGGLPAMDAPDVAVYAEVDKSKKILKTGQCMVNDACVCVCVHACMHLCVHVYICVCLSSNLKYAIIYCLRQAL